MKTNQQLKITLISASILSGCLNGTKSVPLSTSALSSASSSSATETASAADPSSSIGSKNGQVQVQSVMASLTQSKLKIQLNSNGISLDSADIGIGSIELSLLDSLGKEVTYWRTQAGEVELKWDSVKDEVYKIVVKNNSSSEIEVATTVENDLEVIEEIKPADEASDSIYKDYVLKGFVGFSRQCKQYQDGGNSTLTVTAKTGSYFVNPIIFWGKVEDKKVSNLKEAKIKITHEGQEITLQTLDQFDISVFKEFSASKEEHINYTQQFYQGYLGAAGQMYTTDTFRFGGDCEKAIQLNLGDNPGAQNVYLSITDDSVNPSVSAQVPLRVTVQPPFSMYEKQGQKLSDWTQCTINKLTAEPQTYNGDADACKQFSFSNLPYLVLDYLMPSKQYSQYTKDSDPTRILFYGYAKPKAYYEKLLENAEALIKNENPTVYLPGCLNVGGLNSVPLSTEKTNLPLGEFNVEAEDVINLSRRSGSYTGLTQFYQGNVDVSGDLSLTTCIPYQGSSCYEQKVVKFNLNKCHFKADSGIAVGSITDSFMYPEYFEMSGIVKN